MHAPHEFQKNALVNKLLQSLVDGCIVWDKHKRLAFLNDAGAKIIHANPPLGTPLPESATYDRVRTVSNSAASMAELPVSRAFRGEDVHGEMIRFVDTDGMHRWLCVSAFRVLDENGGLEYVVSTFSDATERKLREDRLKFMVEAAKILSVTADFRQRLTQKARLAVPILADWCAIDVVDENGRLERIALVHEDESMLRHVREYQAQYPENPDEPTGANAVVKTGKTQFVPRVTDEMLRAVTKTDQQYEAIRKLNLSSVMILPIRSDSTVLGAMSLAYAESGRTYTESDVQFMQEFCHHMGVVLENGRLFDEVRRRDKAKDLFLASLSHELRNPLAPIRSSLELLKMKGIPNEVRDDFEVIEHQFAHMSKLLNDLLDVTRFTQNKITITPRALELRRLVERALRGVESQLRSSDITLHFTYPSQPLNLLADETRLEQAVTNLMANAAKYTPPGGSIWVELERDDHTAVVRIRDNGAGIHPEDLPNIFQMYYQGADARRNVSSGLGIGLLLVQRIVSLHKGTIEAKSEGLGLGSEFIIRLPLSGELEKSNVPEHSDWAPAKNIRILVVDDNTPAANALVKLLNKLGASADASYSGFDALARVDIAAYDLFILDVGMPHMDGYELVRALRDKGIRAPVIALTGYGLIEDKQRAEQAGFDAHLTKPVGVRELNEMFSTVIP